MRRKNFSHFGMFAVLSVGSLFVLAPSAEAALIGTFVEVSASTTDGTDNGGSIDGWGTTTFGADDLWRERNDFIDGGSGSVTTLFEADTDEANLLTTTSASLAAGTYDVYVVFGDNSGSWGLQAALSGGTLAVYGAEGPAVQTLGTDTGLTTNGGDQKIFQALLGQTTIGTGGTIAIDVNSLEGISSVTGDRSWYHGMTYQAVPATATVPEPSTTVLALLGVLGMVGWGRRRRKVRA